MHAPFWMGAAAVGVAILILAFGRRYVDGSRSPAAHSRAEGELVAVADAG